MISAPVHDREVVYGLISTDKHLIFHLMDTFQIPGSEHFDAQISMHTATQNSDVILALEFQKHFSNS